MVGMATLKHYFIQHVIAPHVMAPRCHVCTLPLLAKEGNQEGRGFLLRLYLKSPVYEYRALRLKAGSDG